MMVLIKALNGKCINVMIEYSHTQKLYGFYTVFCTIKKQSLNKTFRIVTDEVFIVQAIEKQHDFDKKQIFYHKNYYKYFEPLISEWLG